MPKIILLVQDSLTASGTELSNLDLIRSFSSELEIHFVYFFSPHTLLTSYQDNCASVTFIDVNQKGWVSAFFSFRDLIKLLGPELLVSSLYRANIFSRISCIFCGTPLIGTIVSDSYGKAKFKEKAFYGKVKHCFIWLIDRITSGVPVHWIANSEYVSKAVGRSLSIPSKLRSVVYRGRVIENRPFWSGDKKLGKSFRFIYTGRLNKGKGLLELLDAFIVVNKSYPKTELWFVGDGSLSDTLNAKIKSAGLEGNVKMTGYRPDVYDLLVESDCFVFPSWFEGFSGSLVEAMICGIPIIASDIPMNLEAVKPDIHALIFPVGDKNKLASAMVTAITEPERMKRLGIAARTEALDRFDQKKISKQYEDLLINLTES